MTMAVDVGIARKPPQVAGLGLLALSFQTLGIIYSDIGTSPLYVLNGLWSSSGPVPSKEDVIGGISCIIWALTLLPMLKYVFIALRFGTDEGEGGCFALYHGLLPPRHTSAEDDRSLTGEWGLKGKPTRQAIDNLMRFKWVLLPWTLFGTSLTLADGVFTPAVSITSAVAGIAVAVPSVANKITGISIAFLVVLFAVQRFGTASLSFVFSPVTLIWLLLIAVTGIVNITHFPGIFRAFDPSRAVMLFVRTKNFDLLAGVLLAVTGCEALFANLGQFNMRSIQLSFGCVTYPSLILAYLGQGARLVSDGENVISNVFYQTIPGPHNGVLFWIMYVFAILATLVASQAMITATFSLIQQVIHLKSFPPLRMIYTSETTQGHVYIPAVNWTLALVTLVVVGAFKSSVSLSNAYGFAVATVMFVTTTLLAVQCRYVKHLPWVVSILLLVFLGFFDGLFFGAALKKVPQGAWVPLMIGCILVVVMVFWSWAKGLEDDFDGANRKNLRHFIVPSGSEKLGTLSVQSDGELALAKTDVDGSAEAPISNTEGDGKTLYLVADSENGKPSRELARIPTMAIFHKFAGGKGIPHTFVGFLRQYPALPRIVVFLSVRIMNVSRISQENRFVVDKVRSMDGFYGVTYQIGYKDDFDVDTDAIVSHICKLEMQAKGVDSDVAIHEIREAAKQTTHIVPHYRVVSRGVSDTTVLWPVVNFVRRVLIEDVYYRLATMFPETANWLTSADEMLHVGITARI
ncbi:potassium transporter [Gautieria morchelliformis]|nr:potassium transporter [Gautieria morchelliformis]